MFNHEPDTVVELYRKYISNEVRKEDLQDIDGTYNAYNVWNTTKGAMHLNCPPNSLSGQLTIASECCLHWGCCAKNRKDPNDQTKCEGYTNGGDLIQCGIFGLPTRASDPLIGSTVNRLIQANLVVSIAPPVGLYMEDLNTTGWQDPSGKGFSTAMIDKIVTYERGAGIRGSGAMNSRIRVEIPDGEGYVLGDCLIGGERLEWTGQLIDASATVFLRGIAVSGEKYLSPEPNKNAVVPCKDQWTYSEDKLVGPLPRNAAMYPVPVFPVEDVSDATRNADLDKY